VSYTVLAEIVGTIFSVDVAIGDAVDTGDPLVVLESMKMEIPVLAEAAGVVREISVGTGDTVSEGDQLMVVDVDS
jgi:biotin carboxyl carrier protein